MKKLSVILPVAALLFSLVSCFGISLSFSEVGQEEEELQKMESEALDAEIKGEAEQKVDEIDRQMKSQREYTREIQRRQQEEARRAQMRSPRIR